MKVKQKNEINMSMNVASSSASSSVENFQNYGTPRQGLDLLKGMPPEAILGLSAQRAHLVRFKKQFCREREIASLRTYQEGLQLEREQAYAFYKQFKSLHGEYVVLERQYMKEGVTDRRVWREVDQHLKLYQENYTAERDKVLEIDKTIDICQRLIAELSAANSFYLKKKETHQTKTNQFKQNFEQLYAYKERLRHDIMSAKDAISLLEDVMKEETDIGLRFELAHEKRENQKMLTVLTDRYQSVLKSISTNAVVLRCLALS